MPTAIGVIFFLLGICCFLLKEEALLGLLILASVFEASSAINIEERGVQPYYLVAALIICRAVANRILGVRSKSIPQGKWLFLFGAIAVSSAFTLPMRFAGIPVYDSKVGIDDGLFVRPALSFGLNNIVQACFPSLSIATAFAIPVLKSSIQITQRAYLWAFYILAFIVFAQSACQLIGISFPYDLILNNPGYSLWSPAAEAGGTRNSGTFSEPSLAGGLLALYCTGFIVEYLAGRAGVVRVLVALAASAAVASSGSLFTLFIFGATLLTLYSPFHFPWYINMARVRRVGWMLVLLIVPMALVLTFSANYRDTLATLTVSKGDSSSFINRSASDLYALQLLFQTYGIGLGLGSSRTSAMLPSLLSNIGIGGVLALEVFFFKLFGGLAPEFSWIRWAAMAFIFNMTIGIADITFPIFWIPVFLAIQFSTTKKRESKMLVFVPARAF